MVVVGSGPPRVLCLHKPREQLRRPATKYTPKFSPVDSRHFFDRARETIHREHGPQHGVRSTAPTRAELRQQSEQLRLAQNAEVDVAVERAVVHLAVQNALEAAVAHPDLVGAKHVTESLAGNLARRSCARQTGLGGKRLMTPSQNHWRSGLHLR